MIATETLAEIAFGVGLAGLVLWGVSLLFVVFQPMTWAEAAIYGALAILVVWITWVLWNLGGPPPPNW